jgi:putative NADPH-quinone reductase
MKILVLLAHPDSGSLNAAIAKACIGELESAGHSVVFHDLYAEGFDPLLKKGEDKRDAQLDPTIQRHIADLAAADGIVVVHPNWWGMPPAILTGWIDRVIRAGVAYKFVANDKGEGVPVGLLKLRTLLVFNTANTPAEAEDRFFGDPLSSIWMKCVCGLCTIRDAERGVFRPVITSTPQQRTQWLEEVRETVRRKFPKT